MIPKRLETTKKDNIFVSHKDDPNLKLKSLDFDSRMDALSEENSVVVTRRGPINPLRTIRTLRGKTNGNDHLNKMKNDPRLKNNPLRGRLVVCIFTTTGILFVFFAQMIFNKMTFGGRCVTKVLYKVEEGSSPYFVPLGHGACEYNLKTEAGKRVFMGPSDSDNGWPITTSKGNEIKTSWHFPMVTDSHSFQINAILTFGGLETNMIRNYGEHYRLIWSTFMHKGIGHILFNLLSQIQILWIIEPDWGFFRTFILYFISGLGGSITSAALDPCHISVGSSGALYGLYGGLVPYIIEYWTTLPYPLFLILFIVISIIVGILMGFTKNIDNYAHLGGCMFGLLWGFASIRSVSIFDKCTIYERVMLSKGLSWMTTEKYKQKLKDSIEIKKYLNVKDKRKEVNKRFLNNFDKKSNKMRDIVKKLMTNGSPPFKNRLREWLVRGVSGFFMIVFGIILVLLVFEPKLYSKFKPWGQPKFSGFSKCTCCYVKDIDNLFKKKDLGHIYKDNEIFWCFGDKLTAEMFCGSESGSGQTDDLLSTSTNAAQHLINTFF